MPLKYLNRNNNSSVISVGNSVLFNGSNQYLSIPGNAAFAFETGNFTIEWWQYMTSQPSNPRVFSIGNYPSTTIGVSIEGGTFYLWENSGIGFNYSLTAGGYLNRWLHFAISRNNGTTSIFKDGIQIGSSYSDTNNINNTSTALSIGQESSPSSNSYFPGYISNFRIVKGTALYTSNFTPPTSPLTAIANTSLLTCQSATIIDNSSNNFTITNNGAATVSSTAPFTTINIPSGVRFLNRSNIPILLPGTQKAIFGYGTSNVTNLVSNTGVVATDTAGVGTSRYGLAAAGYGGDKAIFGYGRTNSNPVSITNLVSNTGVVATDTAGVGTARNYLAAAGYGSDKAIFGYGDAESGARLSMTNLVSNTGVVATDTTGVGTARGYLAAAGYGSDKAIFGHGNPYNYTAATSITNLVSNTGVVATDTTGVGTARFGLAAAGFSVSYAPTTSNFKVKKIYADPALITTGLTLYFDAGNASSYPGSGTTWTDLTGNGNTGTLANGPTYTSSFGGGIVFDGINDQVNIPSTYIPIKFGTSAYSIEMWIRPASITNRQGLVCTDGGSGTAPVFAIQGQGTNGAVGCGTFSFGDTVNTGTNNGVSLNQWAHVVLSRASTSSNDAFIYINSTLKATGTLSTNYSGTHGVGIGYTPTAGEYFSGTIAIVRIYKGYALSSGDVLQNYNLTKTRFGL